MNLKDKYFPVLKHGFISLIDTMGTDQDIEKAARLSFNKFDEVRETKDTTKLLRYLIRKHHTSPFEQAVFKFHIRLPIYVMRQWVRHRTASLNEMSQRYSEALDLYDTADDWRLQSVDNKQGSDGTLVFEDGGAYCGKVLSDEEVYHHKLSKRVYQHRLESGVAREQARKDLPLSTYTEMVWTMDLHNLLHFLNLRCKGDAQLEIQKYANIIAGIVKNYCPISFNAWQDYVFEAVTYSHVEQKLLNYYIDYCLRIGIIPLQKQLETANKMCDLNMSKREIVEFSNKLDTQKQYDFDITFADAKPYSYFQEQHHEESNQMAEPTP